MVLEGRPAKCHGIGGGDNDLDWEDWDPKSGSFIHHMIAGSFAGIAEHTVMFPVDTIKTFVQCQECTVPCVKSQTTSPITSLTAANKLIQQEGFFRLWRGVSTMLSACVPAHAAYFSALELCKDRFGVNGREHNVLGAASAGAIATVFHDSIMTPMDVIKQRLQLGYYKGLLHCATSIAKVEGIHAFYLSLPVTLFMNIPYGCVMVAANESIKRFINPSGDYTLSTYMIAGSGAGALAAAATTPLDLIKTRLQTQVTVPEGPEAGSIIGSRAKGGGGGGPLGGSPINTSSSSTTGGASNTTTTAAAASAAARGGGGGSHSTGRTQCTGGGLHHHLGGAAAELHTSSSSTSTSHHNHYHNIIQRSSPLSISTCLTSSPHHQHQQPYRTHVTSSDGGCMRAERTQLKYTGIIDAARQIRAAEGYAGFFRGMVPRLMVHTPSVAISWTTYEVVKDVLQDRCDGGGCSQRGT